MQVASHSRGLSILFFPFVSMNTGQSVVPYKETLCLFFGHAKVDVAGFECIRIDPTGRGEKEYYFFTPMKYHTSHCAKQLTHAI